MYYLTAKLIKNINKMRNEKFIFKNKTLFKIMFLKNSETILN
jgi:hypothetical protein